MGPPFPIPFFRECSVFLGRLISLGAHTLFDAVSFQPCLGPALCSSLLHFLHLTGHSKGMGGAATHPSVV